jgi:hypothetical protein
MKLRRLKKLQSNKSVHECWARQYPYFYREPTLPIPADMLAAITAPENAHLFTAEAAHNTFVHLRTVPKMTPRQMALHGELTKSEDAFSLENAVRLYKKRSNE